MVAMITLDEAKALRVELARSSSPSLEPGRPGLQATDDAGYFYFIQLEPIVDPGRFKVGFTVDLDGRLQKLLCYAAWRDERHFWGSDRKGASAERPVLLSVRRWILGK